MLNLSQASLGTQKLRFDPILDHLVSLPAMVNPDLPGDLLFYIVSHLVHHLATLVNHQAILVDQQQTPTECLATLADQQNGNIKMCDLLTNLPTDVGVGEMLTHGKNDSIVLVKNVCSGACSQHCSEFIRDPGEEGCW